MRRKIMELTDPKTFWDDVRKIVGYKDLEDWEIKRLQAIADYRYGQLISFN